jgi:hypothetical protein
VASLSRHEAKNVGAAAARAGPAIQHTAHNVPLHGQQERAHFNAHYDNH